VQSTIRRNGGRAAGPARRGRSCSVAAQLGAGLVRGEGEWRQPALAPPLARVGAGAAAAAALARDDQVVAGELARPARPYDMRSTYASNQLAAGMATFELARLMGTSTRMIEKHYGTLLDGAGAGIVARQAAFEAEQERARDNERTADS
jgi:hypothetical protein